VNLKECIEHSIHSSVCLFHHIFNKKIVESRREIRAFQWNFPKYIFIRDWKFGKSTVSLDAWWQMMPWISSQP
jgi:hypothetical protein